MKVSANLGFLWTDLSLPDAIRAAGRAGFDAVECHHPYAVDPVVINIALHEAGLLLLVLNTDKADGMGLSAVPGREVEAQKTIDQAIDYAIKVGAKMVHIMAGFSEGPAARSVFIENLRYGLDRIQGTDLTLLIEPLNAGDVPGYFLNNTSQAADIISEIGSAHLRLMFDCYHVQITEAVVIKPLSDLLPIIGHVQIAAVPDRGEPDHGDVDYGDVVRHLASIGYKGDIGAEYRPCTTTDAGLGWLPAIRAAASLSEESTSGRPQ